MNVKLPQWPVPTVDELMRLARSHNQHVSSDRLPFLIPNHPLRSPFDHINDLVIVVLVQPRSSTRLANDQKERDAHRPMIPTPELMRHSHKWQLRLMEAIHARSISKWACQMQSSPNSRAEHRREVYNVPSLAVIRF
jgi:hypothetical protein